MVHNQSAEVTNVPGTDIVELEGFSSKEATGKTSTEIVTTLITELESMSSIENLSSKSCPKDALSVVGTKQQVEINSADKWALVTTNNGGATRPVRAVEGCVSPNGFQLLQDMREEGEIDEEEEVEEVGSEVEEVVNLEVSATSVIGESCVAGNQEDRNKVTLLADSIEDDESNTGAVATKKQNSAARGRGRGSKRPIVNSRGLVQAVGQQQKVQNSAKKASSRRL